MTVLHLFQSKYIYGLIVYKRYNLKKSNILYIINLNEVPENYGKLVCLQNLGISQ